jgi:hypothetical protein
LLGFDGGASAVEEEGAKYEGKGDYDRHKDGSKRHEFLTGKMKTAGILIPKGWEENGDLRILKGSFADAQDDKKELLSVAGVQECDKGTDADQQ